MKRCAKVAVGFLPLAALLAGLSMAGCEKKAETPAPKPAAPNKAPANPAEKG